MKIVLRDGWKQKPDTLICENVSEFMGQKIIKLLNESEYTHGFYYQVVSDEYELKGDK